MINLQTLKLNEDDLTDEENDLLNLYLDDENINTIDDLITAISECEKDCIIDVCDGYLVTAKDYAILADQCKNISRILAILETIKSK
jgi:phosphate uptake regulator